MPIRVLGCPGEYGLPTILQPGLCVVRTLRRHVFQIVYSPRVQSTRCFQSGVPIPASDLSWAFCHIIVGCLVWGFNYVFFFLFIFRILPCCFQSTDTVPVSWKVSSLGWIRAFLRLYPCHLCAQDLCALVVACAWHIMWNGGFLKRCYFQIM